MLPALPNKRSSNLPCQFTPQFDVELDDALIETLHEHGVIDKTHFAHAFARALDTLAPEHCGGMIEHVLRNMRDRCMNLPAGQASDATQWLKQVLNR